MSKLTDMTGWSAIVHAPMAGQIGDEDAGFCKTAADCLPESFDADTWSMWTSTLKAETGRKGKGLFLPLRLALTGRKGGPSMGDMLQLIGPEKAKARLRGGVA